MNQTQQTSPVDALSCITLDDAAIVSVEPRTSYAKVSDTDFVPLVLAAVKLGRGGLARVHIAHFVILELDRRFLAAKEKDGYLTFDGTGYKSVTALCAHLGISRKHYYHVRNHGQRQLTAEEQAAKDERLKLQETRRARAKAQKAEDRQNEIADAKKPLEEKLRIAEASITAANAANQVRENATDSQAVSAATTAAAQVKTPSKKQRLQLVKTRRADGKLVDGEKIFNVADDDEVNTFQHFTAPQTDRDRHFYNLGYQAANVRRTVGYVPPVPQDTDEESAPLVN